MTGEQFKRLIKKSGLSQQGMARALGIDPRTVRAYIAGAYSPIPVAITIAAKCIAEHQK